MKRKEKSCTIKIRKKDGKLLAFIKGILRIFKKKPKIINVNDSLESQAIFLANHSAASGPMTYEMYFPKKFVAWGTHEMLGNFKERWNYLYHIFYRKKLGYGKLRSFCIATVFAPFSKFLYNLVDVIPTYRDGRFLSTVNLSSECLDAGSPIMIFPEDSNGGYKEIIEECFGGFVMLCKSYYRRTKKDIPVYPVYYSKRQNTIVIDEPLYVNAMLKKDGANEVKEIFLEKLNSLFREYIATADAA